MSKLAFELKGTFEGLDDVQHDAQSEARAARGGCRIASGVASEESIPDLLLIVLGDTNAGIFDLQSACGSSVIARQAHPNPPSGFGVLNGIFDKVLDDETQVDWVGHDHSRLAVRQVDLDPLLAGQGFEKVHRLFDLTIPSNGLFDRRLVFGTDFSEQ